MSNVQQAYTNWSAQYDTNINRTRDLEAVALQTVLAAISPKSILEIGCGTGKNTVFLETKTENILAVDLTNAMLEIAKQKVRSSKVLFTQADITQPWNFTDEQFDLITFSLVLEHIENLDFIFEQAAKKLQPGGRIYVGELHPFKQYAGTKARFGNEDGSTTVVDCFNHHTSDFVHAGKKAGLSIEDLQEFFDDGDSKTPPRILTLIFTKKR